MKKIFLFMAACAMSIATYAAASITVSDVDFGTVSIKGQSLPLYGSTTITVTWSGLTSEGTSMYAEITEGMLDEETNPNGFYVGDPDFVYLGYGGSMLKSCEFQIGYGVKAAGTFTGKLHLYAYDTNWETVDAYANITITVTDDAIVAKTTPYARINSTSELQVGDTVVFVCESAGAVSGPLNGTYLPAVTEGVKIDQSAGKADVPETAQSFVMSKYNGNWQFTATGTSNKLALDITGKGAFTYADAVPNQILVGWGISISSGTAYVSKPDETFPVEFNADRFKPYKSPQGSTYQLYKKVGEAQEVQSSLVIDPTTINFGNVGRSAEKEITIHYTAENIEDDILWVIQGADADEFELTEDASNTRTSGSLTIKYLGKATKSTLSAELAFLTLNAQMDNMEGAFPIAISLVDFNGISFKQSHYNVLNKEEKDFSTEIVFDPADVADKSLTWAFDKTYYFATLSDAGVFKATATGDYVLIATSVLDETKQAKCTVTVALPTPTAIELGATEHEMHIGDTWTLTATVVPEGTEKKALFESDNTDVATVNKNGVITAKAIGTAVITVSAEGYPSVKSTCTITVSQRAINSITFADEEVDLTLGSTLQLNPIIDPAEAASEYTITYHSGNEEVATVDDNGKVTAVAAGDAVITATIGGKSGSITIHVIAAATFAKVFDPSSLAAKDTIILATIYGENGVIAGALNGKKLNVLTEGVTVTETEAYADDALRLVIGTIKNKSGFSLQPVGSTKVLAEQNNDLYLENTTSSKNLTWQFVADGSNGVYVLNVGNTNAMFKYHAGNAAIKPYKASTGGAVYVYVYVRKYRDPQGIEDAETGVKAHKVLRDGQLLIIRNGETFNANGVKVD